MPEGAAQASVARIVEALACLEVTGNLSDSPGGE